MSWLLIKEASCHFHSQFALRLAVDVLAAIELFISTCSGAFSLQPHLPQVLVCFPEARQQGKLNFGTVASRPFRTSFSLTFMPLSTKVHTPNKEVYTKVTLIHFQNIFITLVIPLAPFMLNSLSYVQCRQPLFCFLSLQLCLFQKIHVNKIIKYIIFCVLLFLTDHNAFKAHPYCSIYQQFIPIYIAV